MPTETGDVDDKEPKPEGLTNVGRSAKASASHRKAVEKAEKPDQPGPKPDRTGSVPPRQTRRG